MPAAVRLDDDEIERINRARLALRLHCLPGEVDAMPAQDVWDLQAVLIDDDERAREDAKKWRRK